MSRVDPSPCTRGDPVPLLGGVFPMASVTLLLASLVCAGSFASASGSVDVLTSQTFGS